MLGTQLKDHEFQKMWAAVDKDGGGVGMMLYAP